VKKIYAHFSILIFYTQESLSITTLVFEKLLHELRPVNLEHHHCSLFYALLLLDVVSLTSASKNNLKVSTRRK